MAVKLGFSRQLKNVLRIPLQFIVKVAH